MSKDIKQYLHLYYGQQVEYLILRHDGHGWDGPYTSRLSGNLIDDAHRDYLKDVKLILRPLSDMTEEEFKEFAKPESFSSQGGYWYASCEKIDPEFEGEVIEHINNCCDDDPENVIMCHVKSKQISYGWIQYEEMYHSFGAKEHAEWTKFLLSKGFDLFDLIPENLAIDATTLKQKA